MQRKTAEKRVARENRPNRTPPPEVARPESSTLLELVCLALAGGLLTWAALPPLAWWPLGWLALVPWWLIARLPQLPGRRPYLALYACGVAYWLLQLQWIRLPHWSASFGWLALALYLGVYFPALIALVRVLARRLKLPLVLAAPVAFTALEFARGNLFTGFALALLGHSQSACVPVIQIADLGGAYAVSFTLALVSAALAAAAPWPAPRQLWPLGVAAGSVLLVLGYGYYRLHEPHAADERVLRAAIMQSNLDTIFGDTTEHLQQAHDDLHARTLAVARAHPNLDVILWPESMFTITEPSFSFSEPFAPPPQVHPSRLAEFKAWRRERQADATAQRQSLAEAVNAPGDNPQPRHIQLLVGGEVVYLSGTGIDRFNSATLIGPQGELVDRYDKMHPVMFGEYVPLGKTFPWLYQLTPMGEGLTPGERPRAFTVNGLRLAPNICFESTVPQLIRAQVVELQAEEQTPDLLVNLTNDGWFWGSSLLDLHLRCSVFRAVETRKPTLVAANTGISAVIDGNGRLVEQGPRREPGELVAEVRPDGRMSPYLLVGDWPWLACLVLCGVAAVLDWRATWRRTPEPNAA